MDLLIKNVDVVGLEKIRKDQDLLCRDGKIVEIRDSGLFSPESQMTINGAGCYLCAGFIDLHIHGSHEFLIDNGPEDLAELTKLLPRYGVTGYLPSICPRPTGEDAKFVASLAEVNVPGARILGFHHEGPFLTHTGALPPEALGSADPQRVKALIEASAPHRAIFSIAPDFEGILDLLKIMTRTGERMFMTHTGADVKQAQAAINAGARHATHFYDVFPAPPETDPGVRPCGMVEAALADPRVSVDFILDGEHVDPVAVKMALQCKGPDRVCLITDANVGAGLPPGKYSFAGDTEIVFPYEGGPARLTEKSLKPGALAGSGLTLDRAMRNAIEMLGVELPMAARMVSANPAQVLGLSDRKGQVTSGYDADLVMLNRDLKVTRTIIAGNVVYE